MTVHEIALQCVSEIKKHARGRGKFLVAITGDSGSGKSYYSSVIRKLLDEQHVAHSYINADDFLISRADREPMKQDFYTSGEFAGKSKWEILENMFRLDEFNRVIDELRSNGEASYQAYRRETGTVDEFKHIQAENLIIFDTSMLLNKMDYVIMIDVDVEKIIARKIVRDSDIRTPEQIEEMHRKVQGFYWQRMKPSHPHIIIDNNDFDHPQIVVNEIG